MNAPTKIFLAALLASTPMVTFGQSNAAVAGFPGMTLDQVQTAGRATMQKLHTDIRSQDWASAKTDCQTAMTYKSVLTPDEDIQLGRDETIIAFQSLSGAGGTAVNVPPAGQTVAPVVPAAVAAAPAAAAPVAPGQVDPSRVSDAGPVHYVITKVVMESAKYEISGVLTASNDTDVHLYTGWVGATSPSGDPNLRCDSVTLGDNPNLNSPTISIVAGRPYTFSVSIITRNASMASLQELRIQQQTQNGVQTAAFENLQPDPAGTVYPAAGGAATPDATAVAGTPAASGTGTVAAAPAIPGAAPAVAAPGTVVAPGAVVTPGAAVAPGSPVAPITPGSPVAPGSPTNPAAVPAAQVGATPAVPLTADATATGLITKLQADAAANQWPTVTADVTQLHTVEKNGVNKTKLSPGMELKINSAIRGAAAMNRLSTMGAPKNPAAQLVKAQLEMDANELSAAQSDLSVVAANPKLDKQDAEQLQKDKVRLAKLQSLQGR